MLQWCSDHTGTCSHIGKHEYHPGTQNWLCNGFYFVLCFPFNDKCYISVYLSGTVLFCISFLSTLHHDGMVHSNTTEGFQGIFFLFINNINNFGIAKPNLHLVSDYFFFFLSINLGTTQ